LRVQRYGEFLKLPNFFAIFLKKGRIFFKMQPLFRENGLILR